jgi:hypothetical protein
MSLCELWSKSVETMGCISNSGKEDERRAGTAPIQNLQLNTLFDSHHLGFMRG